jgi:hypothetical protein
MVQKNRTQRKQAKPSSEDAPRAELSPENRSADALIVQRALVDPSSLNAADFKRLQRTIGNWATTQIVSSSGIRQQGVGNSDPLPTSTSPLSNAQPAQIQREEDGQAQAMPALGDIAADSASPLVKRRFASPQPIASPNFGQHVAPRPKHFVVQRQPQDEETLQMQPLSPSATPLVIQRTLEMDGSWAYMFGRGWATGAKEVWDVIKPKFDQLSTLTSFLSQAKGEDLYRIEDITPLEKSVEEVKLYDRKISLEEGKTLQTKLSTLPLGTNAEQTRSLAATHLTQKKEAAEKEAKAAAANQQFLDDRTSAGEVTKSKVNVLQDYILAAFTISWIFLIVVLVIYVTKTSETPTKSLISASILGIIVSAVLYTWVMAIA